MRRTLLGAALATICVSSLALAAPQPRMQPSTPIYIPPAFSWTGFYVGANVGYSWGKSNNDWNFFAPSVSGSPVCPLVIGGALCASGSDATKLNGALGGFQAGYNWQISNWVMGVETDFQFSGQSKSQTFNTNFPGALTFPALTPLLGNLSATYTERLESLSTLRGRVGFAADRWLLYATGGLAYGRLRDSGSSNAVGRCPIGGPNVPCPFGDWSNEVTKIGWTLGAGAEGVIVGNWSWKVEYLHVDLGSVTTNFATLPGCYGLAVCFSLNTGTGTIIHHNVTDDIVRVGINYRFGPILGPY